MRRITLKKVNGRRLPDVGYGKVNREMTRADMTSVSGPYVMCKTLGRMGRLGNQMFQYALLLGVAKRTGLIPTLPYENKSTNQYTNLQLDELFNIAVADCSKMKAKTTIREPYNDIRYLPRIESLQYAEGNIDFHGYYQSEKYFKHAEAEVRNAFVFKNPAWMDSARALVEAGRANSDTCKVVSLHVRRGDYIKLPLNFPFSEKYYERAMESITQKLGGRAHFIIASDDVPWCKQFFPSLSRFGTFSYTSGSIVDDLAMMRCTDHCIISNSSFSWWGAWLNETPGKQVLAPNPWFGPKGPRGHDLYAEGWTIIPG